MELPFELNKYHKTETKYSWKKIGLDMSNFNEIYENYITARNCDICNKTFKNTKDRRFKISSKNVVCYSCINTKEFINRDDIPFILNKHHKSLTKYSWKKSGLDMSNFNEIYENYITSRKCEICEKTFKNSNDRMLKTSSKKVVCFSCLRTKEFINRDDIPFILNKHHKSLTKSSWKNKGLIFNDNEFEAIYEKYITSSKCELCSKTFKKSVDRHMEHEHKNGKFRNIVCNKCNQLKSDNKKYSSNTSGYAGIAKHIDKNCKQGFIWEFSVHINGKIRTIKSSINKDFLIEFADNWKLENNYHT